MRRLVFACVLLLGSAAVPASAHAAASRLSGYVCQTSSSPAQRAISVSAVMRPLGGSARLAMRFQLFRRTKRFGPAKSLGGAGLRKWVTPHDPTLGSRRGDVWVVKHPVVDLAAPAYYRFRVTFLWRDAGGKVVGHRTRQTPTCFQPQLQPDLQVAQAGVTGKPGHYFALVGNAGATASSGFTVEAASPDDGTVLATSKSYRSLAGGASRRISFQDPLGRPCPSSGQLDITVRPSDPMDDANPMDNTLTVACSAAAGGA